VEAYKHNNFNIIMHLINYGLNVEGGFENEIEKSVKKYMYIM